MEIVVSLVVGGLAGFSVATACGVDLHPESEGAGRGAGAPDV